MNEDIFRPTHQPARAIYDAFQDEASKRKTRTVSEWVERERMAVFAAAKLEADARGVAPPTMIDVERAESYAYGSADYGAKWAYQLANQIMEAAK